MAEEPKVGKWVKDATGEKIFSPSRDFARLTIMPLTREAAERLGHIAWIEEKNPAAAIAKMVGALKTAPVNCAIWANADVCEPAGLREKMKIWREGENNHLRLFSNTNPGSTSLHRHFDMMDSTAALSELRRQFAAATGAPPVELEQHMERRLKDLFAALPKAQAKFQLRAEAKDVTSQHVTDHIDGSPHKKQGRFIETISGPGTYLFDNKDAVYYHDEVIDRKTWGLPRQGKFTVYETPPASLALFSSDNHPWQPILHGEPFLPPDQKPKRRTVAVYDFKYPE